MLKYKDERQRRLAKPGEFAPGLTDRKTGGKFPLYISDVLQETVLHVPPIEEMSHLSKRLGNSGIDRIRYAGRANTEKQPRSFNLPNTLIQKMQFVKPNDPGCPVGDWMEAASRLESGDTKPLNINRLYNILHCIEMINTREIMVMTGLSKRHAQKYLRAIKFVFPFLEEHFSA